jgi:hypothetical protein
MMSRLSKVLLGIRNRWRYGDVDDSGNNVLGDAKPPEWWPMRSSYGSPQTPETKRCTM